jgi:hypothetical protein
MPSLLSHVEQYYAERGWSFSKSDRTGQIWVDLDAPYGVIMLLALDTDHQSIVFDACTGVSVSSGVLAAVSELHWFLDLVALGQDPADVELRLQYQLVLPPGVPPSRAIELALDELLPRTDLLRPVISLMRQGSSPRAAVLQVLGSQ